MRIAFVASCLFAASSAVATWDMDEAGNLVKPEMFVAIDRANLAQASRGRPAAKGGPSFWDKAKNFGSQALAKGKEVWGDLKLTPADLGAVQKWTTDVGKTATACMKDWKTPACLVGATNNVLGAAKGIWSKANSYSANKKARLAGKKAQVGASKGGWLVQRANPDMFAEAQPVKNAKEASAAMKSALAGKPNAVAKEAAQNMAKMAKKGQIKAQVD